MFTLIIHMSETQLLGRLIMTLDKNITSTIRYHITNDGNMLLKNIVFYTRSLVELMKKLQEHDEIVRRAARYLFNQDGPYFIQIRYRTDSLMNKFNWTLIDLENFQFLIDNTKDVYSKFENCYIKAI